MNTIELLLSLFFIGLVGFLFGKFKVFDEAARKVLIKFVFYVATSALLIEAVLSINIHDVGKFSKFTWVNTVIMCVLYLATYAVLRIVRTKYKSGASILYAGNVSNNVYIGLPFVKALYGTEGLVYAVILLAIPLTISDLVNFYVLSSWKNSKANLKSVMVDFIKNPLIISILIGALLLLLGIKLPESIDYGLNVLGGAATGLALFAMGLFLSMSVWKNFNIRLATITSFIKLLAVPALTYLAARYIFHLTGLPLNITVIMSAFPSAIFCMVAAGQYDFDERATADSIMLSSLLFMATSLLWIQVLK